MIVTDSQQIEAINNGTEAPDAFYNKTKLMATSQWISTDEWRGHNEIVPEPGYKIIEDSWVTGDWSDAPSGHSAAEVEQQLKKLEPGQIEAVIQYIEQL